MTKDYYSRNDCQFTFLSPDGTKSVTHPMSTAPNHGDLIIVFEEDGTIYFKGYVGTPQWELHRDTSDVDIKIQLDEKQWQWVVWER